jgi:hypothetical protein
MTATELRIKRMQLPAVPTTENGSVVSVHHLYAEVTSGGITAEVERFSYWDPHDGRPDVEVTFEVRINGMPDDNGGTCELYATTTEPLQDLAAVCGQAAQLLAEANAQHKQLEARS